MTVESDIENGLMTRVSEFAASYITGLLPVAFPDVPFTPPDNNDPYLEVIHFRNTNGPDLWGTTKRLRGILQVSVIDPKQEGTQIGIEIGSAIANYFEKNTRWNYGATMIKITNTPTLLTPLVNPEKTEYPVSIPYRVTQREA